MAEEPGQPAGQRGHLVPYQAEVEGWTPNPDRWSDADNWPNTVTVSVVTAWGGPELDDSERFADSGGDRELVQVDTNYKSSRESEYPVRLTRPDAVELAAHLLNATEDTFHYARCGQLRATEAAALLRALARIDGALQDLREHALQDLLDDTGLADDGAGG